jgi:hypothetical protein
MLFWNTLPLLSSPIPKKTKGIGRLTDDLCYTFGSCTHYFGCEKFSRVATFLVYPYESAGQSVYGSQTSVLGWKNYILATPKAVKTPLPLYLCPFAPEFGE